MFGNCIFFWGPASMKQIAKIVAYILLATISTILVIFSPFYVLACKSYKAIPLEIQKYKEIKAEEEKEKSEKQNEK